MTERVERDVDRAARRAIVVATVAAFLLTLALQLVLVRQYRVADPFASNYVSDALSYDRWATRIADHGIGAEPVFHQSPLYPVLLAALYASGDAETRADRVLVAQALWFAFAVAALVPLGRRLFNSTAAGAAAAALALAHGPLAFHALKLLPVTLAVATQATGLWALVAARRRGGSLALFLAGAAWGVACLARAEMLLFVPLGALAAGVGACERRRAVLRASMWLLGCALCVAPATVHNARKGDFVLVAAGGGENIFIGNRRGGDGGHSPLHPAAGDLFSQREWARREAESAAGRPLAPSAVSAHWRARALDELLADPAAAVALVGRKAWRLVVSHDPSDMYSLPLERSAYLPLLRTLPLDTFGVWLLGLTGLVIALRAEARRSWPAAALVATHVLLLLAFFVSARLRVPVAYLLCPFAGYALVVALRNWRAGRHRTLVVALGLLAVASAIYATFVVRPAPREAVRLASVLSTAERHDESLAVLRPWLSGPAADPLALDQAGWVLTKQGRLDEAAEHYRRALDGGLPAGREPSTRSRLAALLERAGRSAEAADEHDRAVAAGGGAGALYERALFRLRTGGRDRALDDLRRAVQLAPGWSEPRETLAAVERGGP